MPLQADTPAAGSAGPLSPEGQQQAQGQQLSPAVQQQHQYAAPQPAAASSSPLAPHPAPQTLQRHVQPLQQPPASVQVHAEPQRPQLEGQPQGPWASWRGTNAVVVADDDPWASMADPSHRPVQAPGTVRCPAYSGGGVLPAVPFARPEEETPVTSLKPTAAEHATRGLQMAVAGRPETHNNLRRLSAMPWYVLEEQLRQRVVNVPGLHVGDDPQKNLAWVACGFDAATLTYPAQHLFSSDTYDVNIRRSR